MITRDSIEEIRNRVDIVDVIGDFISLKKAGHNYKALSPFSQEKTPSFFVVPSKGIFKDFSSGKGGDAITFVMEHEGMSYVEALRYLASKYGVELKEDVANASDPVEFGDRERLYAVMAYAAGYFQDLLHQSEEGQTIGLTYLRERQINDSVITRFGLGYSLNEWDGFYKKAMAIGYEAEILERAGLVVRKDESRLYDRFRGRIIFPIHNLTGKVIAFGARILTKEKDQPKYINSPETEIYHKSDVLYGIAFAKNVIRQEDRCYLVEGYTDVISMFQSGIENCVASSGTALTENQIKLIHRFTSNITVLFDGDAAGIKAALRGIDLVLEQGMNVRIVLLPDKEDPDSYSRKHGSSALKEFLKANEKDFVVFKTSLLMDDASGDAARKAEVIRDIVQTISIIPDAIKRAVYIQEASQIMKLPEATLLTELNKILIKDRRKTEQPLPAPVIPEPELPKQLDEDSKVQVQERESIRILLNYSELLVADSQRVVDFMLEELSDVEFRNPVFREIYESFMQGSVNKTVPQVGYFIEQGSTDVRQMVASLTTERYEASKHWQDKYKIFFPHERDNVNELTLKSVLRFKFRVVNKMIRDNLEDWKNCKGTENEDICFEKHLRLKEVETQLAKELGIVVAA